MQTEQEADLIYHRAGDSPWTSSRTQPCFTNRLCSGLSQIQEPKVLNTTLDDTVKDLKWVLMCGHICKASTPKAEARFSRELRSPFLALPYRFDFPKRSVPSVWCLWPCCPRSQALGDGTGLLSRNHLSLSTAGISLLKHLNLRKHRARI